MVKVRKKKINYTVNNSSFNSQVGKNNYIGINVLDDHTTEDEKKELEEIAKYIDYVPKAYMKQIILKMKDFKVQCDTFL